MPSAVRNNSRAWQMGVQGKLEGRGAEIIAEFDMNDPLQVVEVIGQAMGFRPTRVAQKQEADWAARQAVTYWGARRSILLEQMFWAQTHNDQAAVKDVWKAIKRYRDTVPRPELSLSRQEVVDSVKTKEKNKNLKERGYSLSRRYRGITEEIRETFPDQREKNPPEEVYEENFFLQLE